MDDYDKDAGGERDRHRTRYDSDLSDRINVGRTDDRHRPEIIDTVRERRGDATGKYAETGTDFGAGTHLSLGDTEGPDFLCSARSGDSSYNSAGSRFHSYRGGTDVRSDPIGSDRPTLDAEYPASGRIQGIPEAVDHDRLRPDPGSSEYAGDDNAGRRGVAFGAPTSIPSREVRDPSNYDERTNIGVRSTMTSTTEEKRSTNDDSTMGKMMEKAGDVLKNDNLAEKGREKREAASNSGSRSDY